MQPIDLSVRAPRSPYVQLAGLYMMARTVDKMRAELPGGVAGEFHYSGFSERLLDNLGISHQALLEVVTKAESDDEVATWVLEHSSVDHYAKINNDMLARVLDDSNRERLIEKYPVLLERPNISKLFDLIDADDAKCFSTSPAV